MNMKNLRTTSKNSQIVIGKFTILDNHVKNK